MLHLLFTKVHDALLVLHSFHLLVLFRLAGITALVIGHVVVDDPFDLVNLCVMLHLVALDGLDLVVRVPAVLHKAVVVQEALKLHIHLTLVHLQQSHLDSKLVADLGCPVLRLICMPDFDDDARAIGEHHDLHDVHNGLVGVSLGQDLVAFKVDARPVLVGDLHLLGEHVAHVLVHRSFHLDVVVAHLVAALGIGLDAELFKGVDGHGDGLVILVIDDDRVLALVKKVDKCTLGISLGRKSHPFPDIIEVDDEYICVVILEVLLEAGDKEFLIV